MESLVLSRKDAQFMNKWRMRIKMEQANIGSPGKIAVKTVRVCRDLWKTWTNQWQLCKISKTKKS